MTTSCIYLLLLFISVSKDLGVAEVDVRGKGTYFLSCYVQITLMELLVPWLLNCIPHFEAHGI